MKPSGSLWRHDSGSMTSPETCRHTKFISHISCTYLDIGFTLASTIARTLQFLIFSGNSWMPEMSNKNIVLATGLFYVCFRAVKELLNQNLNFNLSF